MAGESIQLIVPGPPGSGETYVYSNTGQLLFTIELDDGGGSSGSPSGLGGGISTTGQSALNGAAAFLRKSSRSKIEKDPVPGVYSRGVIENVGMLDQKQERILSTGELRPKHVENVDVDNDGTLWVNRAALTSDNSESMSFNPDQATTFTKFRVRGFNAGLPANAKVRGFKVKIKRKKQLTTGDIQEDAGTPLLEETVKLSFDKWKFSEIN